LLMVTLCSGGMLRICLDRHPVCFKQLVMSIKNRGYGQNLPRPPSPVVSALLRAGVSNPIHIDSVKQLTSYFTLWQVTLGDTL
jgi:hypothetical protein